MEITPESLKQVRTRSGITQKELSRLSGVSQSMIAKIESGSVQPSFKIMKDLNDALILLMKRDTDISKVMNPDVLVFHKRDPLKESVEKMIEAGISQVPVMDDGKVIGTLTESSMIERIWDREDKDGIMVGDVMEDPLPQLPLAASSEDAKYLLLRYQAVLVYDKGGLVGIVTKSDLIKRMI